MSQALQETARVDWSLSDPSLLRTQAFIDGQWVDADSGATFKVYNPATHEVVAEVADVGADETRRAIEAAAVAQKTWAARPAVERSAILKKWNDLILENIEDLAILMTVEQGKILAEALTRRPSSNGLRRKANAFMATCCRCRRPIGVAS